MNTDAKDLFGQYESLKDKIFEYFGYVEDWRILPLVFDLDYLWKIEGSERDGVVRFAKTRQELESGDGDCYENDIYTNRHLPKWVYRGEDYTMICVDTHCDGNQYLQVFSNKLEIK